MKLRLLPFLTFLLMSVSALAQNGIHSFAATAPGRDPVSVNQSGTGIAFHKITWVVSGTVSACVAELDSSPDNSTWSSLIAVPDCHTSGASVVTAGTVGFISINPTTVTGGGTVTFTWDGFVTNGGGTTPGSTCGDSTHALGWTGSAYNCQAITGSAAAGGSTTQLQFNNATALGGISGWTTNGTTTITGGATSVFDSSAMSIANLKLPAALAGSGLNYASGILSIPNAGVTNAMLVNPAITIGGTSVALGGSTSSLPSPGAIGGTTPAAITGTTVTANTSLTINGGTAQTGTQGTDTKLLTAGTLSGTLSPLCTDANGGATTVSCPTGGALPSSISLYGVGYTGTSTGGVSTTGVGIPNPLLSVALTGITDRCLAMHSTILANTNGVSGDEADLRGELNTAIQCSTNLFPVPADGISGGKADLPSGGIKAAVGQYMFQNQFEVVGTGPGGGSAGLGSTTFLLSASPSRGSGGTFQPFVLGFGMPAWNQSNSLGNGNPGPYSSSMYGMAVDCNGKADWAGFSIFSGQDNTHEGNLAIRNCPVADVIGGGKSTSNGLDFQGAFITHADNGTNAYCIGNSVAAGGTPWTAANWTVSTSGIVVMNAPTGGAGNAVTGANLVPGVGVVVASVPAGGTNGTLINGDFVIGAKADMASVTAVSGTGGTANSTLLTFTAANDFPKDSNGSCSSAYTAGNCQGNAQVYLSGFSGGATSLNTALVTITSATGSSFTGWVSTNTTGYTTSSGNAGFSNAIHQDFVGTPFTAANQIAWQINTTLADSGTPAGTGTLTAYTEGIVVDAPNNLREISGITHAALSCKNSLNADPPLHGVKLSGNSLYLAKSHIEQTLHAGIDVGDDDASQGVVIDRIQPVTNVGFTGAGVASSESVGVKLSSRYGSIPSVNITNLSVIGGLNRPTDLILDQNNSNTLLSSHNTFLPFYIVDNSGTGVWTDANPVDLTLGIDIYNGTLGFYTGGTQNASITQAGAGKFSGLTLSNVATGTQCLHANSSGVVSGTGSDCGSGGSTAWSSLTNGSGNLAITPGGTSIFSTTSALSQFFGWKNTTAAVVGTSQGSPLLALCGRAFHSSADVEDCMTLSELPGNGNDAAITFTFGHTGSSTGPVTTQFPGPVAAGAGGGGAGALVLPQGTAIGHSATTSVIVESPASVTSYEIVLPGASATGVVHRSNSSNVDTESVSSVVAADITSATITHTQTDSTFPTLVASGTSAMGTGAITSGTCATVVTTTATGTATTDTIIATPNADPTGVTGYAVSATGSLYIQAYPTSNNVNFKVCNNTSGSLTPSALTLNWKVIR